MKMQFLALIATFLFGSYIGVSQNKDKFPVFVLYETSPWTFYPGSESPTFALYDDGSIIYRTRDSTGAIKYYTEILDSSSFYSLIHEIEKTFSKEKYENILSKWTDQPTEWFYIFTGDKRYAYKYYGNLNDKRIKRKVSKRLYKLYNKLSTYHSDKAKIWEPEKYELLVQTGDSTTEGILWNKKLPDLTSTTTRKISENFYSIYLTQEEYKIYLQELRKKPQNKSFIINNKKAFILTRIPFPKEEYWMH